MSGSHELAFSVSETGIFIHFVASDGSETQVDALTVLDCSSAMTNRALIHWCYERLDEVEIPEQRRWDLAAAIDEIASAKEAELRAAEVAGAHLALESPDPLVRPEEWLRRAEQLVGASDILLSREAFDVLLSLARSTIGARG